MTALFPKGTGAVFHCYIGGFWPHDSSSSTGSQVGNGRLWNQGSGARVSEPVYFLPAPGIFITGSGSYKNKAFNH